MKIDPEADWLKSLGDAFLRDIYEEALRRDPDDAEALEYLALVYTREGRAVEGLRMDLRLAALHPEEPVVRYNLACSLALTGDVDGALREFSEAVRLGYDDPVHARADGDLSALRGDPRFEEILRAIGG